MRNVKHSVLKERLESVSEVQFHFRFIRLQHLELELGDHFNI